MNIARALTSSSALAATALLVGLSACSHLTPSKNFRSPSSSYDPHPKRSAVTFDHPSETGCYTLSYRDLNTVLQPGDAADFVVPKEYHGKHLTFVTLGHGALNSYGQWDDAPQFTSLQFKSSKDQTWRYWGGPSSADGGAKFAEYRGGGLELEGLYEWGHYGHYDLDKKTRSLEPLSFTAMRAVSTGVDPVLLGEVTVRYWPDRVKTVREYIITPGTKFGDYRTTEGSNYSLDYGSAHLIYGFGGTPRTIDGATLDSHGISIPLKKGEKLRSVEVACGDAPEQGSDPGAGRLYVEIRHANGTTEQWIRNENVPPAGILKAATPRCDFKAEEGDVVQIYGDDDRVWAMGVRLGLD